ncbi:MAG: HD-GYP domain-containing protein, partial [Pseudomonadota bacterium]|nr:HD-GYP domain-containing protein [Pseudomonadota bacterium]
KAQLPSGLLAHAGALDATQTQLVRTHVELSLRILDDGNLDRPDVHDMIRTHHERFDGSGYPGKLRNTEIPLFGRMAAIIDSFDAMASDRPHARAITRHDALQLLYRHRDQLFQHELVEQFTACLGVYPVGSLVELSGGEVGVVMAQNPARRLRPRILLLTDRDKKLSERFAHLDLMAETRNLTIEQQTHIVRSLAPGAYGLDPAELYL